MRFKTRVLVLLVTIAAMYAYFSSFFSSFFPTSPRELALNLILRPATYSDLDAITDLGLAALPDDPIWPYRFPKAKLHPEDHYKFSRLRFSEYLSNVEIGVYAVMVVEASSDDDPSSPKIIAMSMWALPGSHLPNPDRGSSFLAI